MVICFINDPADRMKLLISLAMGCFLLNNTKNLVDLNKNDARIERILRKNQ